MRIEQQLNQVRRGRLLASNQSTREEWVDALQELNALNDDGLHDDDFHDYTFEDDNFEVSCMYSLLRLHPDVCMLECNHTTNPGT
jgi:hypothetical protein